MAWMRTSAVLKAAGALARICASSWYAAQLLELQERLKTNHEAEEARSGHQGQ